MDTLFLFYYYLQHCKIYLCGTKSDLIEADRSVRQVDYHDVQDFADGKHVFSCFCFLCATITKHFNKTTLTFNIYRNRCTTFRDLQQNGEKCR